MSTAVVLAGGRSSRMPFDKQTIRLEGKLIAVSLADRIAPLFDRVVIVSNRPELYEGCLYEVIPDQIESHGPISGFYTGMLAAVSDKDDYVYFVACDMPFVRLDYISYMRTFLDGDREVVAVINKGHIETFNAFYHKGLAKFIKELLAQKQYSLLRIYDCRNIFFIREEMMQKYDKEGNMFVNINSLEDYERYLGNE